MQEPGRGSRAAPSARASPGRSGPGPGPGPGAGPGSSSGRGGRVAANRFRPLGASSPSPSPAGTECTHPVQVSGLCAVCGRELDRASLGLTSIAMAHSSAGIKVSRTEAERLDSEATQDLLSSRRLALIIDLDQTVIHATVDPTVGEWLADPANPNYPALEGVGRFKLAVDGHTVLRVEPHDVLVDRARRHRSRSCSRGPRGPSAPETDHDETDDEWDDGPDGCWYYVKPRKGLHSFLTKMATKYELHVYTMGTRSYADCVCQLVDPTGTLFGARILSRDENGSMLQKSLARLFPMDTSMVVVIDDRADVWKWSPNLVKVVPYEFFVGIGDINASFLPPAPGSDTQDGDDDDDDETDDEPGEPAKPAPAEKEQQPPLVPSSEGKQDGPEKAVQAALAAQVDDRPLAKMQQALETDQPADPAHPHSHPHPHPHPRPHEQEQDPTHRTASLSQVEVTPSASAREGEGDAFNLGLGLVEQDDLHEEHEHEHEHEHDAEAEAEGESDGDGDGDGVEEASFRPRVLRDDDEELPRVAEVLGSIHANWYAQWDAMRHMRSGGGDDECAKPQVEEIIARLKAQVLAGCTLVFSGVFPLDTDPYTHPLVRAAQEFGAHVQSEITPLVTHLVAARPGTEKSRLAQRAGVPHIVYPDWLHASIAHWTRMPERAYALPLPEDGRRSRVGTPAPEGPADPLSMPHMDWGVAADEIDAFLDEEDDGDDDDDDDDDDENDETDRSRASSVAAAPRDRQVSVSPPKRRLTPDLDSEPLSPLSKRRKLAEARKGQSKLKHTVTLDEAVAAGTAGDEDDGDDQPQSRSAGGGEGQREGEREGERQSRSGGEDDGLLAPEGPVRGRSPSAPHLASKVVVRRLSSSSVRPSRAQSEAGDSVDLDAFADDLELELDHGL